MVKISPATARKIKIIEDHFGDDWKSLGKSIDALYNEAVGDNRKNLFCKIEPETKERLDEMLDFYNVKLAMFMERLIEAEYKTYTNNKSAIKEAFVKQFTNT